MLPAADISKTARSMALFRALETAKNQNLQLFRDPFASSFLPALFKHGVRFSRAPFVARGLERFIDWNWPGARSSGVARTRLIDDWLDDKITSGATQLVILGAGFDCRAYRMEDLSQVTVMELDRAPLLAHKRTILAAHDCIPNNVRYVPIDFLREDLQTSLLTAGYAPDAKTVFLWEGVTNYLDCEAISSVFNFIAGNAAPGSSVIFTYIHKDVLNGRFSSPGLGRLKRQLEKWGEPWTFGFRPEHLSTFLNERGFELTEDMGASDYRRKYFGALAAKFRGYEFYRVACANLTEPEIHK